MSFANVSHVSFWPSGSAFCMREPQAVKRPPQRFVPVWKGERPLSNTATFAPRSWAWQAAIMPAPPQPKTTTSASMSHFAGMSFEVDCAIAAPEKAAAVVAAAAVPRKLRRLISILVMLYSPFILMSNVWQSLHSKRGFACMLWQFVQLGSPRCDEWGLGVIFSVRFATAS